MLRRERVSWGIFRFFFFIGLAVLGASLALNLVAFPSHRSSWDAFDYHIPLARLLSKGEFPPAPFWTYTGNLPVGDYLLYASAELTNVRLIYLLNLIALASILFGTARVCQLLTARLGLEWRVPTWLVMALLLSAHILSYGTHTLLLENVASVVFLAGVVVLYRERTFAHQAVAGLLFAISAYLKMFLWPFIAAVYVVEGLVGHDVFPGCQPVCSCSC